MVIQQVLAVPDSFAIVERATGALVGAVALKHEDDSYLVWGSDEAELGYWIGVPFQGRGYATEAAAEVLRYAFEDEGIHAVWAGYYDGNERSRRVQEKLGFVHQFSAERDVSLLGEHRIEHCQRWMRKLGIAQGDSRAITRVALSSSSIQEVRRITGRRSAWPSKSVAGLVITMATRAHTTPLAVQKA